MSRGNTESTVGVSTRSGTCRLGVGGERRADRAGDPVGGDPGEELVGGEGRLVGPGLQLLDDPRREAGGRVAEGDGERVRPRRLLGDVPALGPEPLRRPAEVGGRVGRELRRVHRERTLRGDVREMQGRHPVRVFGRQDLRDGAAHVAAGHRVARVAELVEGVRDDPGDPVDRHAGRGERGREREARQRGNHHVHVGEQGQDALEPQHRVRPAVQQHDHRGVGVRARWWITRRSVPPACTVTQGNSPMRRSCTPQSYPFAQCSSSSSRRAPPMPRVASSLHGVATRRVRRSRSSQVVVHVYQHTHVCVCSYT